MICNKCGAKNSESRAKCFHCGNILMQIDINEETEQEKTLVQEFFVESVVKKQPENLEETNAIKNNTTVDSIESNSPVIEEFVIESLIEDTNETLDDLKEESIENTIKEEKADEQISDNETDLIEDITEEEIEEYFQEIVSKEKPKKEKKHTNKKSNRGFNLAIWILTLVFIIGSIFIGTLIYQYIIDRDTTNVNPGGNTVEKLNLPKPEITKIRDKSGAEYIHAIFKGTPGDRLHLKCNNTYHTFITDTLEIDLYLKDLFNIEYEFHDATVNANLNAYYLRDNKEYSYEISSVQMSVPQADIDTSKISSQNIKVYNDKYYLEFWTSTDAKVELNNKNITTSMDGTGNFKYAIEVLPDSKTTYSLSVTQPYRTPKNVVFVVSRDPLPVTLTIAANNTESISDKTITLKCQTEKGAEITASLPIIQSVKNDIYNTCEITLSLEECTYGEIDVLISATNEKGTSTKTHTFMYWPDEKTVTTTSSKFTTAVATNPNSYLNKNFVLNSVKVTKNIGANKFEGIINISGVDYTVVIDKTDIKTNVIIGSSYKIFASCTGEQSGSATVLRAWFIYNA